MGNIFDDGLAEHYKDDILLRWARIYDFIRREAGGNLVDFSNGHHYYGLHLIGSGSEQRWVFREHAPNAKRIYMVGDFSQWRELEEFRLNKIDNGNWEAYIDKNRIEHGQNYILKIYWDEYSRLAGFDIEHVGDRIPSYANRVVQDSTTHLFCSQVWQPETPYKFKNKSPDGLVGHNDFMIYECHVGMAQESEGVGTFEEFRKNTLPRIVKLGYSAVQFMAIAEHPYYGSFGYHVSNYFAVSSRFGTPEEFKALVDEIHGHGMYVIMDIVHSHSVKNEVEGLAKFDGTDTQYFHGGERGKHTVWDSCLFNYGNPNVVHFLLSNCKYWLEEYKIDGYRFDGITSMLYSHHGLGFDFGDYKDYYDITVDYDAIRYLALANIMIHQYNPQAITIAEDVSGMPGLCVPFEDYGYGFDYRIAMGVTEYWYKLIEQKDEEVNMFTMWHELTNKRNEERVVSYVECHDQSLVGGKTFIFSCIDKEIYYNMHVGVENLVVERGVALHKLTRAMTALTSQGGYLTFMGNEFGHPEWIDFPREGNGWSYKHARRLWSISDDSSLLFEKLKFFEGDLLKTVRASTPSSFADSKELHVLGIYDQDKVIAFARHDYVVVANFHPHTSYTDYRVNLAELKHKHLVYKIVLDSDSKEYGGLGRLNAGQEHFKSDDDHLMLYLPSRTIIVLAKN